MFLHFLSGDGGVGLADACEEQLEVVVDLGAGAHGGAWVAGYDLLLDGDGGGQTVDEVAVGFAHAPHELPGIRGEAFDIAPLALGIECVESE